MRLSTSKTRAKYGNRKTEAYGILFDSRAEANRYAELMLMQRAGKIDQLKCQVPYVLAPGVRLHGEKRARPAILYLADFEYFDVVKGGPIVEDVKGRDTPLSRLKRHLMLSVLGIDVRITR